MYQLDVARLKATATGRSRLWPRVGATVWLLGLTSLVTDISSEMVTSVLPVYVVLHLRLSPLEFGVIDGLYQGMTAILRLAGGLVADRWRRYKEAAAAGYALSALCKLGLLAVGSSWTGIAGIIALDRAGKGLRTAPRDAMISLSTASEDRATAFGVHRAMDAAGAMMGPLAAFGILALVAGGFDVVFMTSFCVAAIGVGVITLLVTPPERGEREQAEPTPVGISLRSAVAPLHHRRFRIITTVGALLSLVTISDAFVYLRLQARLGGGAEVLPLMFVGTSLAYLLLAVPAGRLADRWGRGRVFLTGYALLGLTYAVLFVPAMNLPLVLVALLLVGAYYAATDGVLPALTSTVVPSSMCGTGLGLLTTVTSLCRLLASVVFGALWTWRGPEFAIVMFGAGLTLSVLAGAILFARVERHP